MTKQDMEGYDILIALRADSGTGKAIITKDFIDHMTPYRVYLAGELLNQNWGQSDGDVQWNVLTASEAARLCIIAWEFSLKLLSKE